MTRDVPGRSRWTWWSVAGTVVAGFGFLLIISRLDFADLRTTIAGAQLDFLALVPVALVVEQVVRAWKWRQLLHPLRRIGTLRLFGAVMAGYFANFLVPFGASPLVRSWLVARLDGLAMSTVLATVALDRLIDGVIFTTIVALVALFAAFPDPDGDIRPALMLGGSAGPAVLVVLLIALNRHKAQMAESTGWLLGIAARLPARLAARSQAFLVSFADGIVWPRETWRRIGIIAASIVIKLIAATHFLWAGLAFGVLLRPFDYMFLIVFFGFLMILTHLARIPGGFLVGAVFALESFGVQEERALAMVTVVIASNVVAIGLIGALTLWCQGVTLADLRVRRAVVNGHA